jgi:hypothetical protein
VFPDAWFMQCFRLTARIHQCVWSLACPGCCSSLTGFPIMYPVVCLVVPPCSHACQGFHDIFVGIDTVPPVVSLMQFTRITTLSSCMYGLKCLPRDPAYKLFPVVWFTPMSRQTTHNCQYAWSQVCHAQAFPFSPIIARMLHWWAVVCFTGTHIQVAFG